MLLQIIALILESVSNKRLNIGIELDLVLLELNQFYKFLEKKRDYTSLRKEIKEVIFILENTKIS